MAGAAKTILAFTGSIKCLTYPLHHLLRLIVLEWWRAWFKDMNMPVPTSASDGDHQGNEGSTVRALKADHAWARDFIPGMGTTIWWCRCSYVHSVSCAMMRKAHRSCSGACVSVYG